MSLQSVEESLARGEFPVELLNVLMSEGCKWADRDARKDHVDEFGDTIKHGESYYCRDNRRVREMRRLSVRSMNKVLRVVFQDNPAATGFAKHFIKQDDERWSELVNRPYDDKNTEP